MDLTHIKMSSVVHLPNLIIHKNDMGEKTYLGGDFVNIGVMEEKMCFLRENIA